MIHRLCTFIAGYVLNTLIARRKVINISANGNVFIIKITIVTKKTSTALIPDMSLPVRARKRNFTAFFTSGRYPGGLFVLFVILFLVIGRGVREDVAAFLGRPAGATAIGWKSRTSPDSGNR
jgi:hypothetical protein